MKTLCAIGEALIDFIPEKKGLRLKDVVSFKKVAGGAPANVAGAVAKLGGHATFLTKLGQDAFGDYIIDTLHHCQIDTRHIKQSDAYDTSLAFVSLAQDGNRDFKFYRRTAADLQFCKEDIDSDVLQDCGFVHFCSVSLVESPMKQAHIALLDMAKQQQVPICFDPNLRLSLWEDENKLKQTIQEFIPYANILKISDEEVEFITSYNNIEDALPTLFHDRCELVIYTMGKDGVTLYTRDGKKYYVQGYQVDVVDTTGAGDSFIGAFLFKVLENEKPLLSYTDEEYVSFLRFANAYAAYTTTQEGALSAMADKEEIEIFIKQFQK